MKAPKRMLVLLYGTEIGAVEELGSRRFVFRYHDSWRDAGPGVPLSLSLPLTQQEHGGPAVEAYMAGLLPDNPRILQALARDAPYRVSPNNPFALLTCFGEECPGAVQFVLPDRLEAATEDGPVAWLDEAGVAEALARARRGLPPLSGPSRLGHFSLPGAQPKTALYRAGTGQAERWGIPSGRTPTTHILKPPIPDLDGQVENEHFCLTLARNLGLTAASSEVRVFGAEKAIVVERYDRHPGSDGRLLRSHQEDMCQALGIHPGRKYEREGGPGIATIIRDVLRASAADRDSVEADVRRFLDAVVFNWLIAGTDAHAKNFSILHDRDGRYRLAPLYDLNSALPYGDLRQMTMSLKVGGHYDLALQPRHWERLAMACRVDPGEVLATIRRLLAVLPDAASAVVLQCKASGLAHSVLDRLLDLIAARCRTLQATGYG
ncbi:type II toxin-antitoxin system HipA family toxin [Falsiroseomonas algicola]|nr:type II toxin-antitoxin system HipA family toxin [Falsiroseomonas algicola]